MEGIARRSVLAPVLVALLVYVVIGYNEGKAAGKKYEFSPSVFIKAGPLFEAPKLLPHGTPLFPPTGFDGQFFFYLSQDPLLTGKVATRHEVSSPHLDNVAYRYQRIFLPALGWLTSWGDPEVLQWTLPLINLIAVLGAGFLLARFLASRGRSPWLSLVFMLSLGVMLGVFDDISDPLAVGLFTAGVVWWLERRSWAAILCFTACLMTREVYVVPVAFVCLAEVVRGRRRAIGWLAPLLIWGTWEIFLRLTFAASPSHGANRPSIVPLLGVERKLKLVLHQDPWGYADWEIGFILLVLTLWVVFFVRTVDAVAVARRTRRMADVELLKIVGLMSVFLMPFQPFALWQYMTGYTRYSAPVVSMLVLSYALRPSRALLGLSFVMLALTFTSPILSLAPTSIGPSGPASVGIGF